MKNVGTANEIAMHNVMNVNKIRIVMIAAPREVKAWHGRRRNTLPRLRGGPRRGMKRLRRACSGDVHGVGRGGMCGSQSSMSPEFALHRENFAQPPMPQRAHRAGACRRVQEPVCGANELPRRGMNATGLALYAPVLRVHHFVSLRFCASRASRSRSHSSAFAMPSAIAMMPLHPNTNRNSPPAICNINIMAPFGGVVRIYW